jgi:ribonucleoside-diphosphate reductase beta chain
MLVWEEDTTTDNVHATSTAPRAVSAVPSAVAATPLHNEAIASAPRRDTPVASVAATTRRVKAADKRIINGATDVNQLVPFKYKWAWEKYLATCANHWMPQEVNMSRDIATWKDPNGLTEDERRIVKRNLGFFVTADSLAANNIVLSTYTAITRGGRSPCSARPEGIHPTLPVHRRVAGLDEGEIFNAYHGSRRSARRTSSGPSSGRSWIELPHRTPEKHQTLLKSLIVFACLMEAFSTSFTPDRSASGTR